MATNSNNLTTEELLLLDNLMYVDCPGIDGSDFKTVEEWVNSIDSAAQADKDGFTSHAEWQHIIDEVKNNPRLLQIEIASTHVDNAEGGGGGLSAVFIDKNSSEAIVAFRGTAGGEWKDDFAGGGMTDTPQQKNALEWYQDVYKSENLGQYEVTVTGHSKGGNKAKYITIMDESVDNCVSFDGQGFSDEFFDAYPDKIAARQSVIENHNVDSDYVNILLNDVGNTTYYYGHNMDSFLEAHCPNSFFDGDMKMIPNPNGQSPVTRELDRMFNSCLRSVGPEDKAQMLELFGSIAEAGFANKPMSEKVSDIRDMLLRSENQQAAAYFLAYSIKYGNAELREGLDKMGLGIVNDLVDVHNFLESIDPNEWRKAINGKITKALLTLILDGLRKLGLDWIGTDILLIILKIEGYMDDCIDKIEVDTGNGEDRKIGSAAGGRPADFHVYTGNLKDMADRLLVISSELASISSGVMDVHRALLLYDVLCLGRIKHLSRKLDQEKQKCTKLESAVSSIAGVYNNYEQRILDNAIAII